MPRLGFGGNGNHMTGEKEKTVQTKSALRRQREREQRYQTILKAAEGLFAVDGYHKTSMEKIADAAEVSVGTVYFYFKNKEDLIVQMLDGIGFELRNCLGAEYKKAAGAMDGFRMAGQVFFEEFCRRHPEKIAIFFRESVGRSSHVEKYRKKIFSKLIKDIEDALTLMGEKQAITFQSDLSTTVMAISILGMFERIAYQYLIWKDRSGDLEVIGKDAVTFIVGGINSLCR